MDKLMELRRMIEPATEDDAVLLSYLDQAREMIITRMYPYASEEELEYATVPRKFEYKQVRIALYLINKRGMEGETSRSENGISVRYRNGDMPDEMLADVLPQVGVPR